MSDKTIKQLQQIIPQDIQQWIQSVSNDNQVVKNTNVDVVAIQIMGCYSQMPRRLINSSIKIINKDYYCLNDVDVCRLYLLELIKQRVAIDFYTLLRVLLRFSDDEEKESIVRALIWLDDSGVLVDSIIELSRTNSVDLLVALGLNNSYPAKFFPELNFNQLVLKLLFSNTNIGNVESLQVRRNKELSRMALDYQIERQKAGRSVPVSITHIL